MLVVVRFGYYDWEWSTVVWVGNSLSFVCDQRCVWKLTTKSDVGYKIALVMEEVSGFLSSRSARTAR